MEENKNQKKVRIPTQDRAIKTKNQIVKAAMKLFAQKGYYGTNTKEIALEAGVSTGCFYSYFLDKKAVFLEAYKIYENQFNEEMERHISDFSIDSASDKEIVLRLIKSTIEAHNAFADFHNELIKKSFSDPDMEKLIADIDHKSAQNIRHYMELLKYRLKVSDIETASFIVYKSVSAVVDTIAFSKLDIDKERIVNELADMLVKYLFR